MIEWSPIFIDFIHVNFDFRPKGMNRNKKKKKKKNEQYAIAYGKGNSD